LFLDQYLGLLLLYFFSPALTSLRAIQRATDLPRVQQATGAGRVSLGTLSELAGMAPGHLPADDRAALRGLTAADGTVLPALPAMAWALWQDDAHRAAKLHLQFEVLR